jgi:hypothetical protein
MPYPSSYLSLIMRRGVGLRCSDFGRPLFLITCLPVQILELINGKFSSSGDFLPVAKFFLFNSDFFELNLCNPQKDLFAPERTRFC